MSLLKQLLRTIVVSLTVICIIVGMVGCNMLSGQTVTITTTADPLILTLTSGQMTLNQASTLVHTRLTNMAQTPEAKEFIGLYFSDSCNYNIYFEDEKTWQVGLSAGRVIGLMKKTEWFKITDIDYFEDIVIGEPKPTWLVSIDGNVVPVGKGIIVESYIDQLNTKRVLR